jgi:hypothetical protein
MPIDSIKSRPCRVCLVEHDDEIHEATLSVRTWFHDQVTQGFFEDYEELDVEVEPLIEVQVA